MKVVLFGATGMVGQAALRECLLDPKVEAVLSIGRTSTGTTHPKLKELVHKDLSNYSGVDSQLTGFDACYFCLGTPSAGKNESDYSRVTYDITIAAAKCLSRLNPQMTFVYISGDGADSSETSKTMWKRVRGKTENALFRLPFKAVYIFRPGVIQPLHGIQSKTTLYRVLYSATKPLLPMLRLAFPKLVITTEVIARAMLNVTNDGYAKKILNNSDLDKVGSKK